MQSSTLSIARASSPDTDDSAVGERLRLRTTFSAVMPIVLGVGLTVAARLLWDTPALEVIRGFESATVTAPLAWVLPPALGALISCTRTLWIEIAPEGLNIRRMLGGMRTYDIGEIVGWGFEHGRDAYSSLPPADAKTRVRFLIRTSDGLTFSARVSGKTADLLSRMLAPRCSPM